MKFDFSNMVANKQQARIYTKKLVESLNALALRYDEKSLKSALGCTLAQLEATDLWQSLLGINMHRIVIPVSYEVPHIHLLYRETALFGITELGRLCPSLIWRLLVAWDEHSLTLRSDEYDSGEILNSADNDDAWQHDVVPDRAVVDKRTNAFVIDFGGYVMRAKQVRWSQFPSSFFHRNEVVSQFMRDLIRLTTTYRLLFSLYSIKPKIFTDSTVNQLSECTVLLDRFWEVWDFSRYLHPTAPASMWARYDCYRETRKCF